MPTAPPLAFARPREREPTRDRAPEHGERAQGQPGPLRRLPSRRTGPKPRSLHDQHVPRFDPDVKMRIIRRRLYPSRVLAYQLGHGRTR